MKPCNKKVYRYLLKATTPDEIYKKYIAPYFDGRTIYTIADMKENSLKSIGLIRLKNSKLDKNLRLKIE